MADNENKIPEDILSSVETEHEGTVVRERPRRKPRTKEKSNKVLLFMLIFIILIIGAGLVWIFVPGMLTLFKTPTADTSIIEEVPIPSRSSPVQSNREIDTDGDGLSDIQEQGLGLSIDNPDTDGDGLSDRDEVEIYFSDPRVVDTDGDGFSDGDEVKRGFDPNGDGRLNDLSAVLNPE